MAYSSPSHHRNHCWFIVNWFQSLWTSFNGILIRIEVFSFSEIYLKILPAKWLPVHSSPNISSHWGLVAHKYISRLIIIGADNGFLLGQCQAIIWTNTGILLIGPLGTNFSELLIKIYSFSFREMHLKISSGTWWPFCLGLNVLSTQ